MFLEPFWSPDAKYEHGIDFFGFFFLKTPQIDSISDLLSESDVLLDSKNTPHSVGGSFKKNFDSEQTHKITFLELKEFSCF